jgi:ATP-binding cassette, subfamily F, member 3
MIHLQRISFEIGERLLLDNIDWVIPEASRLALIGPNGAGKTTLFRVLNSEIQPNNGKIIKPKDYQIGYLPQEEIHLDDHTVLLSAMKGKPELLSLSATIELLREKLTNPHHEDSALQQLGELEHQFEILGGYTLEADAKAVLTGLGFCNEDFSRSIREFSGGWRMRVYLARLLLQNPNLLLLDEPTNHLDLPSLEWLEQYLIGFHGSIVIISHDRYFIDRLAREIYELDDGRLKHYAGNYHFYEKKKQAERLQAAAKAMQLSKEREKQQAFIERFRYKSTKARQVQSRIKMMERLDDVELLGEEHKYSFSLTVPMESYHEVLKLRDVFIKYDHDWVLEQIDLDIYRGQKIAIVGENGAGKTTLTRLMVGQLAPQMGKVVVGQRVLLGYYAQHQTEALNLNATAFDEVASTVADSQVPRIRDMLGLFGFHGDDVFKTVGVLSGGEKARISLTKILLSPVNFLIMDEPTNHLDILSKEALENALLNYNGTLLLISHDRYFLDKLVNKVIEVMDKKLREYDGNYTDYLERRPKVVVIVPAASGEVNTAARKSRDEKRKAAEARQAVSKQRTELNTVINTCEENIERLERRKVEVETALGLPATYKNGEYSASLTREYHLIRSDLEEFLEQWVTAHHNLEELMDALASGNATISVGN